MNRIHNGWQVAVSVASLPENCIIKQKVCSDQLAPSCDSQIEA